MKNAMVLWDMIAEGQEKHIRYWLALHPNRTPQEAYDALYGINEQEMEELQRAVLTTLT